MPTKKVLKKEKPTLAKKSPKKIEKKLTKKVVKKIVKKEVAVVSKKKIIIPEKTVKPLPESKIQVKNPNQDRAMVIWTTGKRKTAIARIKFSTESSKGEILINKQPLSSCSLVPDLRRIISEPLVLLKREKDFSIRANVKGGGNKSQVEAVRLGIARALVKFNPEWRKELKSAGFLKRDPRKKERNKPGLKRARRAPQWSKR